MTDRIEITDPRMPAAIAMIGRTGARSVQIRFSDDEQPTLWMAVAEYAGDRYEVDASLDPVAAVLRLAERLIDGGQCRHCRRPTGLATDINPMPMADHVCWYQWDPELATFRRSCEHREQV